MILGDSTIGSSLQAPYGDVRQTGSFMQRQRLTYLLAKFAAVYKHLSIVKQHHYPVDLEANASMLGCCRNHLNCSDRHSSLACHSQVHFANKPNFC